MPPKRIVDSTLYYETEDGYKPLPGRLEVADFTEISENDRLMLRAIGAIRECLPDNMGIEVIKR